MHIIENQEVDTEYIIRLEKWIGYKYALEKKLNECMKDSLNTNFLR